MPAGIPSADASIDVPSDVDVSPVAFEVAPTSFPSLSAARDYFIHHPHTLAVGQYFGHWLNVRHMLGRVPSPSDRHLLTLRVDKIRIEGRNGSLIPFDGEIDFGDGYVYSLTGEWNPNGGLFSLKFTDRIKIPSSADHTVDLSEQLRDVLANLSGRTITYGSIAWSTMNSKEPGMSMTDGLTLGGRIDAETSTTTSTTSMAASSSLERSAEPALAISCTLDMYGLLPIPVIEGCPIASQPVESLALVCRYLAARDLIRVYQCNRLLSAAASHPFTFRVQLKIGVDANLYRVESYARGPSATFATPDLLRSAFAGKLFRHFRIVYLSTPIAKPLSEAYDHESCLDHKLEDWLNCFKSPTAPHLRPLSINLPRASARITQPIIEAERLRVAPIMQLPCFQQLTLLHIHGPILTMQYFTRILPPSVEIYHMTLHPGRRHQPNLCVSAILTDLWNRLHAKDDEEPSPTHQTDSTMAPPTTTTLMSRLHTLIVDQNANYETTAGDVSLIAQLSALPQMEAIHWRLPLRCDADTMDWKLPSSEEQLTGSDGIEKVRYVLLSHLPLLINIASPLTAIHSLLNLTPFTHIDALVFENISISDPPTITKTEPSPSSEEDSAAASDRKKALEQAKKRPRSEQIRGWPTAVLPIVRRLKALVIQFGRARELHRDGGQMVADFVASAGVLERLETLSLHDLNQSHSINFASLFANLPNLTGLSLHGCEMKSFDDFKLLPQLTSLHSFHWPSDSELENVTSLASHWPSLTYLHVDNSTHTSPSRWSDLLQTAPRLRQLRWRRYPVMDPSTIAETLAQLEAARLKTQAERDAKDKQDRESFLAAALAKAEAAMAAMTKNAPKEEELVNWFKGSSSVETAEQIAMRLKDDYDQQHQGARFGVTEETQSPTKVTSQASASTNSFVFVPITSTTATTGEVKSPLLSSSSLPSFSSPLSTSDAFSLAPPSSPSPDPFDLLAAEAAKINLTNNPTPKAASTTLVAPPSASSSSSSATLFSSASEVAASSTSNPFNFFSTPTKSTSNGNASNESSTLTSTSTFSSPLPFNFSNISFTTPESVGQSSLTSSSPFTTGSSGSGSGFKSANSKKSSRHRR